MESTELARVYPVLTAASYFAFPKAQHFDQLMQLPRSFPPNRLLPAATGVCLLLGENVGHDASGFDACESLIETLIAERQPIMIDAQLVQNRGVQVADVDRIAQDVVAVIVGFPVLDSRSNSAAGEPSCKAATVMVSSVIVLRQFPLRVDGATEFAAADNQCVVQHSSLLKVFDKSPRRVDRCRCIGCGSIEAGCRADPSRDGTIG